MPFYNFGLEGYLPYALGAAAILAVLLSLFRRAIFGIYFLVPLLPLQTIRYRLNDLPLGSSIVYVMLLAIGIGVLREGKPLFPKTPWTWCLAIYTLFLFVSLWTGAGYLNSPTTASRGSTVWRLDGIYDHACLFLMVVASVRTANDVKKVLSL